MAIDTSDPRFQKALLVFMVVVGVCYGYFMYVYGPKKEQLEKTEVEVKKLSMELRSARALVQAADTLLLIRELEKRQRQLELVKALLPEKENLAELLESITRIGERSGVKFALFEPKAPIQHELYQERPYAVTLRGGYHQTARFLTEVASLPQIVKPMGLSMVRDIREDSSPGETLTAEITLTTYLMVRPPQEQKEP